MQALDFECVDSDVPLFDVVISMPPGAQLKTIQILAETEAGLPPDRVDRLIKVLRSTPNAKVGSGLSLELAEQEKLRFIKAGLHVQITPHLPTQGSTAGDTALNLTEPAEVLIRAQVRAELEKEYNNKGGFFSGKAGLLVGTTLAIAAGLFYAGEKGVSIGGVSLPWNNTEPLPVAAATPAPQQASSGVEAAGAATELTGGADVDDPLIQAVRASGAAGTTSGNAAVTSAGAASAGAADAVSKQTKQLLTAEFASLLAEIGQGARAREVLKALAGGINPATDTQAASALQAAQLKLQAWSAQRMDGRQAVQAAEDLKVKTQAIANAQERMQLQGQLAVILSRNSQLQPEVARAFLSLGAESLKAVGSEQTNAALGDLAVSTAEVFLNETTASAKTAAWTLAKANAAQIEGLFKQAPDAWAQSRLYAVDHQAKLQTGQNDKAAKSLDSALALTVKNSNLAERALWLRSVARLSDASLQEPFEAVANSLQAQLNAKSGIEKARGLTELSLLYATAGLPGRSAQLRDLAQATVGLSATDSLAINTGLLVRNDMAMAKVLHGLGRYADAEAVLQRVAGYLF